MLDNGRGIGEVDEFAENSIDSIPEPTADDLLGTSIVTAFFGEYDAYTIDKEYRNDDAPVADHPSGHMFNRVNGINFCACDCEYCNGAIPAGKHYPSCICTECECDG